MKDETRVRHSKFMAYILRHKAESFGLKLDENGWAETESLIGVMGKNRHHVSMDDIRHIVEHDSKKRYSLSGDHKYIRAAQGHSVTVDLGLKALEPPEFLYHGTVERFLPSIKKTGLDKMDRHAVHLSEQVDTAKDVGSRRGAPVVLKILAHQMYQDGLTFHQSDNGVWLTHSVPLRYILF
ncbi:RNA 2'-phosphotransferase [Insolitispirillum peregrinum]|uniref:RNA 2'-phosphotransferase n=1 Tax=Insolitispirillum peregrinum TaxID=80876 RepID=UPI00361782F9